MRLLLTFALLCASALGQIQVGILSPSSATVAGPAVAKDTMGLSRMSATGTNTGNLSALTVASGHSNTAIVLMITSANSANSVTSITDNNGTWPGTPCTTARTGGTHKTEFWALVNPATGSHTITVNWDTQGSYSIYGAAYSLYNVNQTTPCSDSLAQATTAAVVVTTASGDYALSMIADPGADHTVTGCTTTLDASNASGADFYNVTSCAALGTTTTFTWSAAVNNAGVRVKQQ